MKIFLDANICLDLLDTTRPTSKASVNWYMKNKDDEGKEFYFSGDFITTFVYVLTQKKRYSSLEVLNAIDALSLEIKPLYITHQDYLLARGDLFDGVFDDFEDLIVLEGANRVGCDAFITNDKALLSIKSFKNIEIFSTKNEEKK